MYKKRCGVFVVSLGLSMFAVCASAQTQEVKEKPRMYTYVAFWTIPRAQWADFAKQSASEEKVMEKAVSDGGIVGYGSDQNLIHQPDGPTHDTWFSALSEGALLNLLDQFYKSGMATSSVDIASTKHWDAMYVSRYYNWHPGSWRGAYTAVAMFTLKPDAPNDAVDTLSKNLFVPMFEKLLADGVIHEYEIDSEAIHTETPGRFWIEYIAASADGLDKVSAAVRDSGKASPLTGPTFSSMVDFKDHRDYLSKSDATYK